MRNLSLRTHGKSPRRFQVILFWLPTAPHGLPWGAARGRGGPRNRKRGVALVREDWRGDSRARFSWLLLSSDQLAKALPTFLRCNCGGQEGREGREGSGKSRERREASAGSTALTGQAQKWIILKDVEETESPWAFGIDGEQLLHDPVRGFPPLAMLRLTCTNTSGPPGRDICTNTSGPPGRDIWETN